MCVCIYSYIYLNVNVCVQHSLEITTLKLAFSRRQAFGTQTHISAGTVVCLLVIIFYRASPPDGLAGWLACGGRTHAMPTRKSTTAPASSRCRTVIKIR